MELAILELLERHPPSLSFVEIADAVDESPTEVLNELRRLRDQGFVEILSAWALTDAGRDELQQWDRAD
jgi:DNA-binding Lrp family transcriptional regulator